MKNLANFIENSEDPLINFELGKEYESIGQTGAAISFYLRTALPMLASGGQTVRKF